MKSTKLSYLALFLSILSLSLRFCSCKTIKTSKETSVKTTVTLKKFNVPVTDSVHVTGEKLHINWLPVIIDSTGKPMLSERVFTQGNITAKVAVIDGNLKLDVSTKDTGFRFDRTVGVLYNDTTRETTTTIREKEEPTWWGKIWLNVKGMAIAIVIVFAAIVCFTLFKRSR